MFVRNFVPSALGIQMNGVLEIRGKLILERLHLQTWEKNQSVSGRGRSNNTISFKVLCDRIKSTETLIFDF